MSPEAAYEAGAAYMYAQEEVVHLLKADGVFDEYEKKVSIEHEDNVEAIKTELKRLRDAYPEVTKHCQSMLVKTRLLYKQHEIIDHMLHE